MGKGNSRKNKGHRRKLREDVEEYNEMLSSGDGHGTHELTEPVAPCTRSRWETSQHGLGRSSQAPAPP